MEHDTDILADDIAEVLITEEAIQTRIAELGAQISADYAGKDPLLVGVLRGVFIFMADLVRSVHHPHQRGLYRHHPLWPQHAHPGRRALYQGPGDLHPGPARALCRGRDRHRPLVALHPAQPADAPAGQPRICTLFNKPRTRLFDLDVAYTGFVLPDKFVVGYGLDYDERYRNLPFVGVLKEEAITRRRLPAGAQS